MEIRVFLEHLPSTSHYNLHNEVGVADVSMLFDCPVRPLGLKQTPPPRRPWPQTNTFPQKTLASNKHLPPEDLGLKQTPSPKEDN